MIGKLIKHEFKATYKSFLGIYALTFILIALNYFAGFIDINKIYNTEIIKTITAMGITALSIATTVVVIINIIQRFSSNLFGNEGYLMFTLPVKSSLLIVSKITVAITWIVVTGIVAILAALCLITVYDKTGAFWNTIMTVNWGKLFSAIFSYEGFLIILACFVTVITAIFSIYLSIAVSRLAIFEKIRVIAAILSFFLLNILFGNLIDLILSKSVYDLFEPVYSPLNAFNHVGMWLYIIIGAVFCIGYFWGISYILNRKLEIR